MLVERSRAGERWSLTRLDFNGRGWDGAVHFGPQPYVEHAGKGALDCPRGRVLILGIGDPLAPRARERLR